MAKISKREIIIQLLKIQPSINRQIWEIQAIEFSQSITNHSLPLLSPSPNSIARSTFEPRSPHREDIESIKSLTQENFSYLVANKNSHSLFIHFPYPWPHFSSPSHSIETRARTFLAFLLATAYHYAIRTKA